MLRLSFMLLALVVAAEAAWAEEGAPAGTGSASQSNRAGPASKPNRARQVRRVVKRRAKVIGRVVPDERLRAEEPPKPSGNLRIYSVNYKEEVTVNLYNPDGSYSVQALAEISHIFKCRRTGLEHDIDTRLLSILSHVYDHFGRRIELLSGYRFQRRTTSHHFHGAAADFRVSGVPANKVRDFVETLDAGGTGIGWYPKVNFVHVDIRPEPSYRWIDYSRSNPDARDKQPPRGFRRRNPQS